MEKYYLCDQKARYGKIHKSFHRRRFQENLRAGTVETAAARLPQ